MPESKKTTLGQALEAHRGVGPGFHFFRHFLSFGVVLVHCRAVAYWVYSAQAIASGRQTGFHTGEVSLSANTLLRPLEACLVPLFFGLSGFLVMGSAMRTRKVSTFFTNRALRIVPALTMETTLGALILGPLFTSLPLPAYFSDPQFFRYFGNILGLITFHLPGVFQHNPMNDSINGCLWTLPAEFWCYALMMLVLRLRLLRSPKLMLWLVGAVLLVATVGNIVAPDVFSVRSGNFLGKWCLVLMFWLGAMAYLYADRIVLDATLFVLCFAAFYLSILTNVLVPLATVPLCYCMAYVGMMRFPLWDRWFKADYSYGIYLYGYPMMQAWTAALPVLALWRPVAHLGVLYALTLASTILFSAISWRFVEKPALRLRKVFLPQLQPAATPDIPPAAPAPDLAPEPIRA